MDLVKWIKSNLDKDDIAPLDRMGDKSAQNIIDAQLGFGYKISKSLKRIPDVINNTNVFYRNTFYKFT